MPKIRCKTTAMKGKWNGANFPPIRLATQHTIHLIKNAWWLPCIVVEPYIQMQKLGSLILLLQKISGSNESPHRLLAVGAIAPWNRRLSVAQKLIRWGGKIKQLLVAHFFLLTLLIEEIVLSDNASCLSYS